jgi:hypothetical protein
MTSEEACLAFLFLLEQDFEAPSCCFIYDNERQARVDLWWLLNKCEKIMI